MRAEEEEIQQTTNNLKKTLLANDPNSSIHITLKENTENTDSNYESGLDEIDLENPRTRDTDDTEPCSRGFDNNGIRTYQISKNVKYYAIINMGLNLFYVFFNSYYAFFVFCYMYGYFAAIQFNIKFLYPYGVYQIINTLVQFSVAIYNDIIKINENDTLYATLNIIVVIVLTLLSAYTIRFTFLLIHHLRLCSPEERIQLKNIRNINVKFLCW
jgi:hypothetical protein